VACQGALRAGKVVTVLNHYAIAAYPVHLVWPETRQMPRKLRIVIDALLADAPSRLGG